MPGIGTGPDQAGRREAGRRFAAELARLLANTRCHNVSVLDVSGVSPVTDFLVLATGTSPRQMKTVCDQAEVLGESREYHALSRSGDDTGVWAVLDFVDVVMHVFNPESRMFYDLDNLWGDAQKVNWEAETTPGGEVSGAAATQAQ